MKKLSLIKLSKNEESKILGGACNFKCSTTYGCNTCSGFHISYALSDNYGQNLDNDIYVRDIGS